MDFWLKTRFQLYARLRHQVEAILGGESKALKTYRTRYEKSLKKKWLRSSTTEFFKELRRYKIVLVGDFHGVAQTQKTQLRILRGLANLGPCAAVFECVASKYQNTLDQFFNGEVTLEDLPLRLQWEEQWGFAWASYRPLFEYCFDHRIPLLALNELTEADNLRGLRQRDQQLAARITTLQNSWPTHQLVVFVGDYHLGDDHLPRFLQDNCARVFLNPEELYFQVLGRHRDVEVEVLRSAKAQECDYVVLSVSPWVKWQSYHLALTGGDGDEGDESHDWQDEIAQFLALLGKDLSVEVDSGDFSLTGIDDRRGITTIRKNLRPLHRQGFINLIDRQRTFYLPDQKQLILGRMRINEAASGAMLIIIHQQSHWDEPLLCGPKDFIGLIWVEALSYFGAKLINPKRKTETLFDIEQELEKTELTRGAQVEALKLALFQRTREIVTRKGVRFLLKPPRVHQHQSYFEAARLLGGLLGEKLFFAFVKGEIDRHDVQTLVAYSPTAKNFEQQYYQSLAWIAELPEPPHLSKKEKL